MDELLSKDSIVQAMGVELYDALVRAGVKHETLTKLVDDELDSSEILQETSDEVFRTLGLKGGQITRIRNGIKLVNTPSVSMQATGNTSARSSPSYSLPSTPSTPTEVQSMVPSASSTPLSSKSVSTESTSAAEETTAMPAFIDIEFKANENWASQFKLPANFSPRVTEGLKSKRLAGSARDEFTRDVCAAMKVNTMYPTKEDRQIVAQMIIRKYPFLADTIGSGTGSWVSSIKNRFKNMRKSKEPSSQSKNECSLQTAAKKVKTSLPTYMEGETEETCQEHEKTLQRELQKPTRNFQLIKNLMEITYPYRRQQIMKGTLSIPEIMNRFPALQLVTEFKSEVARVLETPSAVTKLGELFKDKWESKILKLAKESPSCKDIFENMDEELEENPDKKKEIASTAAVLALSRLMKNKKKCDIVKICSEDESVDDEIKNSEFPRIVAAGQYCKLEPVYLVTEQQIILKLQPTTSVAHTQ